MIGKINSKTGIPIRLTDERWAHITDEHHELADLRTEVLETVFQPERLLRVAMGKYWRYFKLKRFLAAIYREVVDDGFIITGFLTRGIRSLERRKQLWP